MKIANRRSRGRSLMRVKFALVLCAFLLLFPMIRANAESANSERVWVDNTSRGITRYFSLHREEDQWWLEEYIVRNGGFQRFVARRRFARPQDAVAEVHRRTPEAVERSSPSTELYASNAIRGASPTTEVPGRVVWKVENAWDWSWELRYSDWVRDNVKADFFQKYQIGVDCADVAFSARWIFARMNHLPAADTLSATGALFTQDVVLKEWEQLPQADHWNEDQLFMAALKYLLDNTYTHTLMRDSYPIGIVKEAFLPGTQHMSLTQDSGHTYVVSAVDLSENSADPIHVIYSTVPAEARRLMESGFWDVKQPIEGRGGFVRFRWPEKSGETWLLRPADQMMFYSTEQYAHSFMDGFLSFAEAVAVKLNPRLDFKARLQNAINTMIERIRTRAEIVEKGEKACAVEDCSEGTKSYENWSTPLRDQGLGETLKSLEDYAGLMNDRVPGLYDLWSKSLQKPAIQLQGVDYSLGAVAFAWKMGTFSSDPRQPVDVRWGLSGRAFRNAVQRKLQQWLDERERKIAAQGTMCLGSGACKAGSPEWRSWQTYDLDTKIQALALGSDSYCDYTSVLECDRFKYNLDVDTITVGHQTKTFRDWLDLSPWLNSDPKRTQEERWGFLKEKYLSYLTQTGETLKISKTGWMLSLASDQKSSRVLKNAFNGKQVHSPDGYLFSALDLEKGLAVAEKPTERGREMLVMNPDDQTVQLRHKTSRNTEVAWISSSRLVLSSQKKVQIFDCSHLPCAKQASQEVSRRLKLPRLSDLSMPGLLLVEQSSEQGDGTYAIVDARARRIHRYTFKWSGPKRFVPKSIQFDTRDYWGGMALTSEPGDNQDSLRFFVRKSDGKVIFRSFSNGTEYLLHLSQNGRWGILAQIYESDGQMALAELDPELNIKNRIAFGKEIVHTAWNCNEPGSLYFLAKEPQSGSRFRAQYYRFSDEGLTKAPLLSDELEAKSGCREEMILKTATGERLRKWGDSMPLFESASVAFLTPEPEEKQIRWVISSPIKDFHQSELYDLKLGAAAGPVLTGSLTPRDENDESQLSRVRSGHLISVGQDRLLWLDFSRSAPGRFL